MIELAFKSLWLTSETSGHESKGKPKVCGSSQKESEDEEKIKGAKNIFFFGWCKNKNKNQIDLG